MHSIYNLLLPVYWIYKIPYKIHKSVFLFRVSKGKLDLQDPEAWLDHRYGKADFTGCFHSRSKSRPSLRSYEI